MSQTPLTQVSRPAAALHVPFSVGSGALCAPSVGTGRPLPTLGMQVCAVSSHQLPPVQSASTLQPPGGSQSLLLLHMVERQTTPLPVAPGTQGPSPTA